MLWWRRGCRYTKETEEAQEKVFALQHAYDASLAAIETSKSRITACNDKINELQTKLMCVFYDFYYVIYTFFVR